MKDIQGKGDEEDAAVVRRARWKGRWLGGAAFGERVFRACSVGRIVPSALGFHSTRFFL